MTIHAFYNLPLKNHWAICMYMYITKAVGREDPQDLLFFQETFRHFQNLLLNKIWARFNKSWNETFLYDGNSSVLKLKKKLKDIHV